MVSPAPYLLLISEREALAWILRERKMAFTHKRSHDAGRLAVGDAVFLVTTRGCFHNPSGDQTRVIGRAFIDSPISMLGMNLEIAGRTFETGCDLAIDALSPYREGLELAPLVERLDVFPNKQAWAMTLRRTLVPLPHQDAELLGDLLRPLTGDPDAQIPGYLGAIKPVRRPQVT